MAPMAAAWDALILGETRTGDGPPVILATNYGRCNSQCLEEAGEVIVNGKESLMKERKRESYWERVVE